MTTVKDIIAEIKRLADAEPKLSDEEKMAAIERISNAIIDVIAERVATKLLEKK